MNNKRLFLVVICIALLLPSSSVYAVDVQGTYYGSLDTQAGTSISITVESETIDYDDYYSYEVNLNKDQIVDVTLEVPGGADFDLFFTTANMDLWWYDLSDVEGQDENQVITVPESGDYLFVVAGYSGDGELHSQMDKHKFRRRHDPDIRHHCRRCNNRSRRFSVVVDATKKKHTSRDSKKHTATAASNLIIAPLACPKIPFFL